MSRIARYLPGKSMPCRVYGCRAFARSVNGLCSAHRERQQRNGHPRQTTIRKCDLKPYLEEARAFLADDPAGRIAAGLSEVHRTLSRRGRAILAEWRRGRPMVRYEVSAARMLLDVLDGTSPEESAAVVLAVFLMWQREPYRFVSDDGFRFQLVRRWRSLSETAVGRYYDHRGKVVRSVYRDPPPRAVRYLAAMLTDAHLRLVAHILRRERRRREARREILAGMHQAIAERLEEP